MRSQPVYFHVDLYDGDVQMIASYGDTSNMGANFSGFATDTDNVATKDDTIRLLLVGKTGAGKSSTGNTIMNRKAFVSAPSQTVVTTECQAEYAHVMGRKVKVVDMPGLADAALNEEEDVEKVIEEAMAAVAETPDGYDAILTVIAFGRLSREEKRTVDQLKAIFGQNYVADYGILLITRGDLFDPEECGNQSFEEWCSNAKGILHELREECSGRVVLFDNKSKDEALKKRQLNELFRVIDEMKSGQRFLPACFEEAQSERDKLILDAKEPMILEKTQMDTRLIMNDLDDIKLCEPEADLDKLGELQKLAETLLDDLRGQDKGTGALNRAMHLVACVQNAISDKINIVKSVIEKRDMEQRLENMQAESDEERQNLQREIEEKNERVREMQQTHDRERQDLEDQYNAVVQEQAQQKAKIKKILVVTAIGIGVSALLTGGAALYMNPAVGTAVRAAAPGVLDALAAGARAAAPHVTRVGGAVASKVGQVIVENIEKKLGK